MFKEYYWQLKNILSAQNLSQYFVSADVITFQDEEEICVAKTSSAKATILLQKLVGPLESGNTYGFHQLLHLMEVHGNIATKDLADKMKNRLLSFRKEPAVPLSPYTGGEATQSKLQPVVVSSQSSCIPQETIIIAPVPPASYPSDAVDNSDSTQIIDLKGTYVVIYMYSTFISLHLNSLIPSCY